MANNGHTEAMVGMGELYLNLNSGVYDAAKGVEWYTKAYKAGNLIAKEKLGYFYLNGLHVKKDNKLAKEILKKDEKLLSGIKNNKKLKIAILEAEAAELGNQEAIKELVYRYTIGAGVKKDERQSLKWFDELNADNQLKTAKNFDEGDIKCSIGLVIAMYERVCQFSYSTMKRYAELCVRYLSYNKGLEALELLRRANADYSTKSADISMLQGILNKKRGR